MDKIELQFLQYEDYDNLRDAMQISYPSMPNAYWRESQIRFLTEKFPEGQVVLKVNDQIAGCALSIIVKSDLAESKHTFRQITGDFTFNTHNAEGEILYGIEVFVKPEFRGLRLGRRLYEYRKELCESLNLKAIVFGGRIPNYHNHSDLTPKEYIQKVKNMEIHDPVLNFQISNDFRPVTVLKNYLEDDAASNEYAVLMRWDNLFYEKPLSNPTINKTVARLGVVQWQMRTYPELSDLMERVEYFVDTLSNYKSDFAVFPELFNAPLMAKFNHLNETEAIRQLAGHTEEIVNQFSKLSISYNINIITGSMPEVVDNKVYNVGYICKRDGTRERYEKLHATPDEKKYWTTHGGNELKTFDTDCGKVGVLVCYDVEFPELPRLLAQDGMDILFVPFLTDTQNAYSRVRNCAQARAIENECYVVIAGSVGNLPNVHNMDIQYAQSMVFTPCDFQFPANGIKAEATPNTEMILVVDVDLDYLREIRERGSVRNMKDRRTDFYNLSRVQKTDN